MPSRDRYGIDLEAAKFGRQETAGIERLITGIALAHKDDTVRPGRASAVFDVFYEYLDKRRGKLLDSLAERQENPA
ncbi:MAG TPA: hypothetical protein VNN77_15970 [candidate division Zixibacteria bacterium]|nr:hypothetical protein [candidate division Zixibacteria bacterium]